MIVMTEAAPGLVPHSAVVPGNICSRVISQPKRLLAATKPAPGELKKLRERLKLVAQRGYEANSKVVKAADDMYQQVNNLTR